MMKSESAESQTVVKHEPRASTDVDGDGAVVLVADVKADSRRRQQQRVYEKNRLNKHRTRPFV